jgi:ABC-type branched-subunit amino acid transport system substrate-binding protein/LysM repeat protein
MKKIVLAFIFLFGFIIQTNAQEDFGIIKSDKIEVINGQKVFLHKVEKGQTLYSIAKAYQVDLKTLEKDTLNIHLKIGQIIYIPVKIDNNSKTATKEDSNYKTHTVLSKETLFGISRKYAIEEEDILNANPELKDGLKVGMLIKIPLNKIEIKAEKPQLFKEKEVEKTEKTEEKKITKQRENNIYNIAMLIPLYLKNMEDINIDNLMVEKKTADNFKSFKYIQFYEAFMMVADSLARQGLKIKIYTFDVPEDSAINMWFLKKNDLAKMDLIIGPFFYKSFKQVADFAKAQKIPIINPFSERRSIIENNPYVFKLIPSYQSQVDNIAKYLTDSFPNANILLIHNNKELEKKRAEAIKKSMNDEFKQNITNEGSVKEIIYNQVGYTGLQNKLSKNRDNILITLIENEIFVTNFVRTLKNTNEQNITIIAPLQWKTYDKIETEYFLNLNTHFFEPYFVDYENVNVKNFVLAFRAKYNTEPNEVAFTGHDVALFFLTALMQYSDDFINNLSKIKVNNLQSNYIFKHIGDNNGFENNFVNIYKMQDYKYIGKNK